MRLAVAAAAAVAVVVLGYFFGYLRAGVGVLMFIVIVVVGVRWIATAVSYQPDPEPTDVSAYDLKYVCRMCGLELKVEVAAQARAPRHCGEAMELVGSGPPPLRPI